MSALLTAASTEVCSRTARTGLFGGCRAAQLHPRLARGSVLVSLEETDVRSSDPARLAEVPYFAVVDVSFISLRLWLPALKTTALRPAHLIALIEPQFGSRAGGKPSKKAFWGAIAAVHAPCGEVSRRSRLRLDGRVAGSTFANRKRGGIGVFVWVVLFFFCR